MRNVLVTALAALADNRERGRTLRFLDGLSRDELLYLAEFLGCCILESPQMAGPEQWARNMSRFEEARLNPYVDSSHKMLLLREYLCRTGTTALRTAASPRPA